MYNNIGSKIKLVTVISTIAGIVLCMILGIIECIETSIGKGILIMTIGPLAIWVSSFMTYGLGQLIENSDKQIELESMILNKIKIRKEIIIDKQQENINSVDEVKNDVHKNVNKEEEVNTDSTVLEKNTIKGSDVKAYDNLLKLGNETLAYSNIVEIRQENNILIVKTRSIEFVIEYTSFDEARNDFRIINEKVVK